MTGRPCLPLGEIAEVVAGDPAPQDPNAFASEGPLFVRMQDVGRHHRHPELSASIDRLSSEWLAQNRMRLFPKGSILIPKSGASVNLNHRAKLARDAYVVSHLAVLIPDQTRVVPDYLYWWSVHYDPRAQAQVTSLPSLTLSTLKSASVPLPSLDEQQQIANTLNRVSKIERLLVRARRRKAEFIPALFVKMFGDPASNPIGWPVAAIGEICEVVGGGTPRRCNDAYFGGSVPWATPTDVTALDNLSIRLTAETITEEGLQTSSARLVPAGTVLLTSRATIGHTAIAAVEMATNQGFANLICGSRLRPEYLAIWLRLRRSWLIQLAGGTTFKEISKKNLKEVNVPLPPIEIQAQFSKLIKRIYNLRRISNSGMMCNLNLISALTCRFLDGDA